MTLWRRHPLRRDALLVGFVAFAVFARTLGFKLVWDDPHLVGYVSRLHAEGGLAQILRADFEFGTPQGYYRPWVLLSLWLDGLLSSLLPSSYHLTNVMLHAASSVLVLAILRSLPGLRAGALAGALLFAVHPIHTESVAFVSGRTDLWAALFTLGATLCWVKGRAEAGARRVAYVLGSAFGLALGALSKEVAFLFPLVIAVWDLLQRPKPESRWAWWPRNWLWVTAWAASIVVVLVVRVVWAGVGFGLKADSLTHSHVAAAATAPTLFLKMWIQYLRLLVFPWPLNAYYLPEQLRFDAPTIVGAALLLLACVWAGARSRARAGWLGLVWIVGFLLPVSGLIHLRSAIVSERFLYLPSFGLCLVAGAGVAWAGRRPWLGRVQIGFACVQVLAAGLTMARSGIWADDLSLFEEMARSSPANPLAHHNLGLEYAGRGRTNEALEEYGRAIQLKPDYASAHYHLGQLLTSLRRPADAIVSYRRAVEAEPRYAVAWLDLGVAYAAAGQYGDAAEAFTQVTRIQPDHPVAYNNLGAALRSLGRLTEAIEAFQTALRIHPSYGKARANLEESYRLLQAHEASPGPGLDLGQGR